MADRARTLIVASLLALACRPTTSIGSTAGHATSTGEAATSTGGETTSGATAMDATTQIGMDGSASESGSSTAFTSDDGPDDTGFDDGPMSGGPDSGGPETGDDAMCMPAQFDSQCIACAKVHCCAEFGACADDFECGCTLGCLQYPRFPGPCMCPPTNEGADLFACLESECDFVCPPVG